MNNLCASGYRLAQTISTLEQWGINEQAFISTPMSPPQPQQQQLPQTQQQQQTSQQSTSTNGSNYQSTSPITTQFVSAWDDLAR